MKRLWAQFGLIKGLITVPGAIALVLWLMAWPTLSADIWYDANAKPPLNGSLDISLGTGLNVLTTIATASITTLSLVYSIVLVVFTLAAGNIAPRLLQRFTKDRVNQVTAGLLGGTFLYALTVLHQTDAGFVPSISIAFAMLLSVLTVLQLIFFVHTVSRSVTIDEEVAAISEQLEHRLERIIKDNQESEGDERRFDEQRLKGDSVHHVYAPVPGYLTTIDAASICQAASVADTIVKITVKPGTFLLDGQPFASFQAQDLDDETIEQVDAAITENVLFSSSRGSENDIEYTVDLLIEIALRALSPGVNDTYTAIACADRLSAAFRNAVRYDLESQIVSDDDGVVRMVIAGVNISDLLNTAFNPLRRAASSNALMLQNLGDALVRLHAVANDDIKPMLQEQVELLIAGYRQSDPLPGDLEFLQHRFADIIQAKG
ncbi:MAG: DUF2254 domain-containing protein [Ahrensia sp.]